MIPGQPENREPVAQLESDAPIRQRIIECAGAIFSERGYRDTTVRDIAGAANVNLAGISYHFGGKQQLYVATVAAAQQARIDMETFSPPPVHETPEEQLRGFIRALLARLVDRTPQDWKSRLLARELTAPTEFCFPQIARWYRPIFEGLMRIVEGVVGRPISEPQRTLIGFSIVGQCLFYRVSTETVRIFLPEERRDGFNVAALADHIWGFTMGGLAVVRTPSPPAKP